ncbi:MAG TPA: LptA/OstA family protein, partial [Burkholderiaceae bacterium]|nr:LptA/OstA family protein [Burkholderiaceae bacterium]
IEGYGNQIEYDGRNETVRLTGNARMLRLPGAAPADEIHGGVIFYDARTEQVSVDGAPPGQDRGRVRVVIQPRSGGPREAPAAAAPAPALKPAPRLAQPPEAPRR